MNAPLHRVTRAVALGALLALGQIGSPPTWPSLVPGVAAANPSGAPATPPAGSTLSAQPSIISAALKPGAATSTTVTLTSGIAQDIQLSVDGLGQTTDGNFVSVPAAKDAGKFTARPFVTVAPQSVHLAAGAHQPVTVTIAVPRDAGQGTRYAIVSISGHPAGASQNVGIAVTLGLSIVVALDGTQQTHEGLIADLAARQTPGQPLDVTATLVNTGDSHYGAAPYQVDAIATLLDWSGKTLASAKTSLTGNSVVPSFARAVDVTFPPAAPLGDGHYHLELDAVLRDGTVLDRKRIELDAAGGVFAASGSPEPAPAVAVPATGGDSGIVIGVLGALVGAGVAVALLAPRRRARSKAMAASDATPADGGAGTAPR